jgi:hypothetical protein
MARDANTAGPRPRAAARLLRREANARSLWTATSRLACPRRKRIPAVAVILTVFALIALSIVLIPLWYAAVLDGRYNTEPPRLPAGVGARQERVVAERDGVSTMAYSTAS